jgi:adenylate cyclase
MGEMRKIAAILVADVVGYSRLAGADEDRTLSRLRGLRSDLIDPAIDAHHGRIVKRTGDGNLIEFRSVVDAVRCAIEVQNGMVERNAGVAKDREIQFRVGIHLGDVVEEADGDLMGDGVNIAARLEGICAPGGICLSRAGYEQVQDKVKESFVDLGGRRSKTSRVRSALMAWRSVAPPRNPTSISKSCPRYHCPTSPRSPSCLSRT